MSRPGPGEQMQSVVLYPGGTAFSPSTISTNQRIVVANPFPGNHVHVEAQIRINSQWGNPEWADVYHSNRWHTYGVRENQLLPGDLS